jgi:cytochrome d ubiquinol oxidase subunit I
MANRAVEIEEITDDERVKPVVYRPAKEKNYV